MHTLLFGVLPLLLITSLKDPSVVEVILPDIRVCSDIEIIVSTTTALDAFANLYQEDCAIQKDKSRSGCGYLGAFKTSVNPCGCYQDEQKRLDCARSCCVIFSRFEPALDEQNVPASRTGDELPDRTLPTYGAIFQSSSEDEADTTEKHPTGESL